MSSFEDGGHDRPKRRAGPESSMSWQARGGLDEFRSLEFPKESLAWVCGSVAATAASAAPRKTHDRRPRSSLLRWIRFASAAKTKSAPENTGPPPDAS
jgi:hypothetical protein